MVVHLTHVLTKKKIKNTTDFSMSYIRETGIHIQKNEVRLGMVAPAQSASSQEMYQEGRRQPGVTQEGPVSKRGREKKEEEEEEGKEQ